MPGYPSDVTDAEWALLALSLLALILGANPGQYAKRTMWSMPFSMWSRVASRGAAAVGFSSRGTPSMTITDVGINAGCGNKPLTAAQ